MLVWCAVLFFLGVLAFIDSVFNMGEVFRQANSLLFLLISLALLIRTTTKARIQKKEHDQNKIYALEKEIQRLKKEQESVGSYF